HAHEHRSAENLARADAPGVQERPLHRTDGPPFTGSGRIPDHARLPALGDRRLRARGRADRLRVGRFHRHALALALLARLAAVAAQPVEAERRAPCVPAGDNRLVIDPLERWREHGEKPDYAGLLTFGALPYTEDPLELVGVDVAIVGAPTDDLVSDRPGARFGPRAIRAASCPAGPHLEAKIDAFAALRMVDFGDAAVLPADAKRTHAAIEATVGQVLDANAIPIGLGGDHSIAEPDIRACAAKHGPVGLIHFDTHTDTGTQVFGVELSHGTPMYRLVEAEHVAPQRYVQIGLRGYWPGER